MSTLEEGLHARALELEKELDQYESAGALEAKVRSLEADVRNNLAAIAHLTGIVNDLNNLMGIMRGHAELAFRDSSEIESLMKVVLDSTTRARQVIEQTLKSGGLPEGPARLLQDAVCQDSAHILVVDDEELICSLMDRLLTQSGHHVVVACDPEDALAACHNETFDLVFMDVVLGVYSGIECAREIKKIIPDIRVLFLSGKPNIEEMQRIAREEHAVGFIRKPFDINDIDNIIAHVMSK